MFRIPQRIVFLASLFLLSVLLPLAAAPTVHRLRTETLENPQAIDRQHPRLSWQLASEQRGIVQQAYHILVATSPEQLANNRGDAWDSGKILSGQSVLVPYAGKALRSRDQLYWKVKVWTNKGESEWSEPAQWAMGLLYYNDWQGRWIGFDRAFPGDVETKFSRLSARYFRKSFATQRSISEARLYIIGLGLYELYLNGQKVGDQVLSPTPTDYTKNVKYNSFTVTDYLRQGDNTVGVVLGNGRYYAMRQHEKPYKIKTFGYPKLLLQLEIRYADGSVEIVKTDDSWKGTPDGPIRTNNEYDGEEYDARKELTGWSSPGYNDSQWLPAEYVQEPRGEFESQHNPNMKINHTVTPVAINELRPGVFIMDMGQNMVGWLRMKVRGKAGDQVTLRYAEILDDKGELNRANLRDAINTDRYTLRGGGEESWEPTFSYRGFQYVEITGYPGTPTLSDFEGQVIYDAMDQIGSFESSDKLLNQIYKNAWWGINGNYKGMPLDCPQRNERQPWLGDRSTPAKGESFLFDNHALYAKWLDDIRYSQRADGAIPDVAPAFWRYYSDNMTWAGTYLMVADMVYRQFGDSMVIRHHYPHMKRWLNYMEANYLDERDIMTKDSYGDWCKPPVTIEAGRGKSADRKYPSMLISTAYHYHYLQLMQQFAVVAGQEQDVAAYRAMAGRVKQAFNDTFYHPELASYGGNSLTDNLLAYSMNLVPDTLRDKVFNTIIHTIEVTNNGHLSTGLVGVQWLMRAVSRGGRPDLAHRLATNTTYPSWGYMIKNGATAIWELWNGNTAAPNMNSYNHVMMLGDLMIWYYEDLAGIRTADDQPGFRKLIMQPQTGQLDYVNASYTSPYGTIKSHWKKSRKQLEWTIRIPENSSALVHLPTSSPASVTEGGRKLSELSKEITLISQDATGVVVEIGSGEYTFSIQQ
jgi:alpha-L-rhamnosidase